MRRLPLINPRNQWQLREVQFDPGQTPEIGLQIFEELSRRIVSDNQSPDLPFRCSVSPYRGCAHGCAYCYARPSHEYLGFGAGVDFERKLVIKPQAAQLLEKTFERKSWRGEQLVFSGNTDPYQPIEGQYGLTRKCLEVCLRYRNPVHIITKGTLVERDIELLQALHQCARVGVSISVTFWNAQISRALEPYAPTAQRRIETIARLSEAKIPVMVNVAPVVYGLSDQDMIPILQAARQAGATSAMMTQVRLPGSVAAVFEERIVAALPLRANKILSRIAEAHGGKNHDPRFGHRFIGRGKYAQALRQMFDATRRRLGYQDWPQKIPETFRRPARSGTQLNLFLPE